MKVNQLKIGVMLSYISMGLSTIISILYTPIMLRLLGQSEYGLYQLVNSVVAYLGLLSFGFGSAYMRFYSRYRVKNDKVEIARLNGLFMITFLGIGVIALLAGAVLVLNIGTIFKESLSLGEISTARILMIMMVINVAISFPASVFDSYVTAHEQYFFQRIVNMLRSVLNPFLCLPLLLMGYKSIGLVEISSFLTVASLGINMTFCFKKLHMQFEFKHFNLSLFKEIGAFSFFIFINMIIDQVNWNVDKFILGMITGTTGVALYAIGAQINSYYLSFSTSISSVFIPRVNRIVAESNDDKLLTEIFTRVGRIQFIMLSLIMSGFIFVGKPFIERWAGSEYTLSFYVALWLMLPVTIPLIQNLGIEIQRAKNMHKFRSWVYLAIAVVNVALSIPLCYVYGPIGCAIGTGITLFVGNGLIMNWYYHTKMGLNMFFFWKEIFKFIPGLIFPSVVGILTLHYLNIHSYLEILVWGIGYLLIFAVSMWFLGLNSYEKALFSGPVKKIINRGVKRK